MFNDTILYLFMLCEINYFSLSLSLSIENVTLSVFTFNYNLLTFNQIDTLVSSAYKML